MLAAHRVLHAPLSSGASHYDSVILGDSPVGFWPLDEASGTTAYDKSGNAHNGTYQGTAGTNYTLAQTGIGDGETAAVFDGTAGYVIVSTLPTTVTTNWTLECWVKLATASPSGYQVFVGNGSDGSPSGGWGVGLDGTINQSYQFGLNAANMGSLFTDANWHYVVLVNRSGTTYWYADAVQNATTYGGSYNAPTGSLTIATCYRSGNTPYRYFAGTVAKAAVYDFALTSTQISNHYAAA